MYICISLSISLYTFASAWFAQSSALRNKDKKGPLDAEEHRSEAPGTSEIAEINSKTCKRQWNLLGRVAAGPRAAQFPQLAEMFRGDNNSKLKALKLYMDANEDLGQCESQITIQKAHMETFSHKRKWMTIKQMKEAGFSETFGCNFVLYCCFAELQCLHLLCFHSWNFAATRKKIQACVARGGMADPDAPLDDESTRYRASLEMEEDEKFQSKTSLTTRGAVSNADAFKAFGQGDPQPAAPVMSADPMALVRQQLALQAQTTPAAPVAAPVRAGAGSILLREIKNQLGWI